jgi:hypothetical protein
MKIFRIFREFLDTKTYKISQFFNKNSKQSTRKYHTPFLTKIQYMKISQKKNQEKG